MPTGTIEAAPQAAVAFGLLSMTLSKAARSARAGGGSPGSSAQPEAGRGGPTGRGGGAASRLEQRPFPTLAAYSQATNQNRHSVLVDYDISVNVRKLDAQDRKTVQRVYKAQDFDFRLKPGSVAVDRGTPLAGITDGFSGTAPDLGALEVGKPLPHYGPR